MCSVMDDWTLLQPGFPIRKSPGLTPECGFPRLIAAYHVLHRLSVPRHPSCALSSLTTKKYRQSRISARDGIRKESRRATLIFNCQRTRAEALISKNGTKPSPINTVSRYFQITMRNACFHGRPLWWAYLDLNRGPRPYQGRALTN